MFLYPFLVEMWKRIIYKKTVLKGVVRFFIRQCLKSVNGRIQPLGHLIVIPIWVKYMF